MTPQRRQAVLVGVMLGMLLLLAGWLTMRMFDHRQAARYAAQDLADCEQLAASIAALRSSDAIASSAAETAEQEQAIVRRVSDAAAKANLPEGWFDGIDHKKARRIGDSPYQRKPAVLLTRGLTLSQLTAMLHHLAQDARLATHELQLRTPPGGDPGNTWDADVTLTYLIYSPSTPGLAGD